MSGAPARSPALATITVNDEPRPLPAVATVDSLLDELGLRERKGIAVAVNGAVAARTTWAQHALAPGDRVLLIRATQGG